MNGENLKLYSPEEQQLIGKLDKLFSDWKKALEKYYNDHGKEKWLSCVYEDGWLVPDGFYPQYLSKKPKILFFGRESYWLTGANYIDLFIRHYLDGKTGPDANPQSINRDKFHKLLLEVSYGILHDKEWNDVPYASDICANRGVFDQTSFAFMNVSKFSNECVDTGHTNTDWNLVEQSLRMSITEERNFVFDEIKLLAPDFIVTMNFQGELLQRVFGKSISECLDQEGWTYHVDLNGKNIPLVNTFHFSSLKSEKDCIYDPIRKAWKEFLAQK